MKKPKLTPWFPADVKPVHVGVYQRGFKGQKYAVRYWYWNGNFWEVGGWDFADEAAKNPRDKTSQNHLYWRGLANPPKATAAAPSTPSQKVDDGTGS